MKGPRKFLWMSAAVFTVAGIGAFVALVPGLHGDDEAPVVEGSTASMEPTAIDFEAVDLQGRPFRGSDLKGRVVVLDFWAVWCAPCIDAFPKLTRLARNMEDEPFELVGVTVFSGDHDEVRRFLEGHIADYTIVVGDDGLPYRYDVIGYPTYLLIDPEGEVVKKYVGALPDLAERIEADARALIEEHRLDP